MPSRLKSCKKEKINLWSEDIYLKILYANKERPKKVSCNRSNLIINIK